MSEQASLFTTPVPGQVSAASPSASTQLPEREVPLIEEKALQGLAGEIVATFMPATEADPAAILMQLLVAVGNVLGRTAHARVNEDRHYLNMYALLIGPSSKGRKGVAWNMVREFVRQLDPAWAARSIQSGLVSGEGVIHLVRDEDDDDPGVTDKRLMIVEGELAGPLQVIERPGNTLSPTLRDAWDRDALKTMGKNSPDRATGAHVSLIGHCTDEEIRRYFGRLQALNGLGNRCLWTWCERSKMLAEGGTPDPQTVSHLVTRFKVAMANALSYGEMSRDSKARDLWAAIYPEITASKPGLVGALSARAEAQVLRLSCLYAILDDSRVVMEQHLTAAHALWKYTEQTLVNIFGEDSTDLLEVKVLKLLRARQEGVTKTELYRELGNHVNGGRLSATLNVLERRNLARKQTIQTDGRPSERWFPIS